MFAGQELRRLGTTINTLHCLQQPMQASVGNGEKVVVFWYSRTLLRVANNVMVSMLHPRAVFKFCLTHHRPSWQVSFAGKLWRRWARLGLREDLYMVALSFVVGNYILVCFSRFSHQSLGYECSNSTQSTDAR